MTRYTLDCSAEWGGWVVFSYFNNHGEAVKAATKLAEDFPTWKYRVTDAWSVQEPFWIKGSAYGMEIDA